MPHPQIKFIKKLVNMRIAAERIGANRKPNVIPMAQWFKIHIEANEYSKESQAKFFFARHLEKIEYIIPSGKPKLMDEFLKLRKECFFYEAATPYRTTKRGCKTRHQLW